MKKIAALLCAFVLVSCGGGGSTPVQPDPGSLNLPMMVDSLGRSVPESDFGRGDASAAGVDGTAADKAPIANAPVVLSDSAGHSANGTTDTAGYYRINIKGFTPPFIAKVTRSDGTAWYSQSLAPVQTRGFITLNLNGLTDKVASYVAAAANLGVDASKFTPTLLAANPTALQAAKDKLNAQLSSLLIYAGLNPTSFDPVGLPYRVSATQPYNKVLAYVDAKKDKVTGNTVVVANYAGGRETYVDGAATVATFTDLSGVAVDIHGNLFVADGFYNVIRKVSPSGVVSTFAGSGNFAFTDGTGTAASFAIPSGIAVDTSGTVFVADTGNNAIRKITPDGVVITLAGNGATGFSNGAGTAASFNAPQAVAVDSTGNVFVADTGNQAIRKISPVGVVSTFAGGEFFGYMDGVGTTARFYDPRGVAVDSSGNVFVADSHNNAIRQITPSGVVSTLAGGEASGFLDGRGAAARFNFPNSVATDSNGNVFVADISNHAIRKITALGEVSTIAGSGSAGFKDGSGTASHFNFPRSVATDSTGNVFVADGSNHRIREITPAGIVSTFAGGGGLDFTNGQLAKASFKSSEDVAVDSTGNLLVADTGNHAIRKVTPAGVVSTLAGSGASGFADGTGTAATFNSPRGIAIDSNGNVFVGDTGNHAIRKITPAGGVTTLAGSGTAGFVDGTGAVATFNAPKGVALDSSGNVFVADSLNNAIRKITPSGAVSTFSGNGTEGFGNGTGRAASFNQPVGVAVDSSSNVFVADGRNNAIRKISPDGVVSTFAGNSVFGFVDGMGTQAGFNGPSGVALDSSGNLFVSDTGNHSVRKITPSGMVSTLIGDGPVGLTLYRPGQLTHPNGLAVGAGGNVFVTGPGDSVIWILLQ